MNNVEKDIEQFEKNLIEINLMKNEIFELKTSLNNMLDETTDINKIKEDISREFEILHKMYEESEIKNKDVIKALNELNDKTNKIESKINSGNIFNKLLLIVILILNVVLLFVSIL